ncbi:hypothetical protein XANCAGTX0491_008978 [Xanthoria calcicola]
MDSLLPRTPFWGFNVPRPELLKVVVDTRVKPAKNHPKPTKAQHVTGSPTKAQHVTESPTRKDRLPILKENKPPLKGPDFQNFGAESTRGYFGGPILNTLSKQWAPTFYTKASGKICFPAEMTYGNSLPSNMQTIIRSVGAMAGDAQQSGLWVGPRHFLSTLHMHRWITGKPTAQECEVIVQAGISFSVETEIHCKLLGTDNDGPKLKLIGTMLEYDLGCFELINGCQDQEIWADLDWFLEREEVEQLNLQPKTQMACIGFNGSIQHHDRILIVEQIERALLHNSTDFNNSLNGFDLDNYIKAGTRSMAAGTLDHAAIYQEHIYYGVSSSLWRGSSGGPCVIMEGEHAGRIIGLVQGQNALADPYNMINGIPTGLVKHIKGLMSSTPQSSPSTALSVV